MEKNNKINALLDRIDELELQVLDLRMSFVTALELIESYKNLPK